MKINFKNRKVSLGLFLIIGVTYVFYFRILKSDILVIKNILFKNSRGKQMSSAKTIKKRRRKANEYFFIFKIVNFPY